MESPPSFSKLAQGDIATIIIKPSCNLYSIHKDLICHYSAYFERELKTENKDVLTIDKNVSEATMDLFVNWLYTGKLQIDRFLAIDIDELLNAVVFGHDSMTPLFHAAIHNFTVDRLVGGKKWPKFPRWINFVFERLPKGNALRELFVQYECCYEDRWLNKSDYPAEFKRMVNAKVKKGEFGDDRKLNACDFHLHESEEERGKCSKVTML